MVALVAEVAAAGTLAARSATTGRFVAALQMLGAASADADPQTEPAIAAVVAAAEAAVGVLRREPWRLVDRHAHEAYRQAVAAIEPALAEAVAPSVLAALDEQHTRAFKQARALWSTGGR
jgi:hypothetical protein